MKLFKILLTIALGAIIVSASAQTLSKQQTKDVKKQAKAFTKEGWKVNPGSLSLEAQMLAAAQAQYELDQEGMPKWVIGEGKSVGSFYDAARASALQNAQSEMVRNMETELAAIATNTMIAVQKSVSNTDDVNKIKQEAKSRIGKRLPRQRILLEAFRELPGGKVECLLRIAIPQIAAQKAASTLVEEIIAESADESK